MSENPTCFLKVGLPTGLKMACHDYSQTKQVQLVCVYLNPLFSTHEWFPTIVLLMIACWHAKNPVSGIILCRNLECLLIRIPFTQRKWGKWSSWGGGRKLTGVGHLGLVKCCLSASCSSCLDSGFSVALDFPLQSERQNLFHSMTHSLQRNWNLHQSALNQTHQRN